MTDHSGTTKSVWMDSGAMPVPTLLAGDLETEVCIIGAGIAGLSTAYQLTREGVRVIVLEGGALVSGETERTTAHLSNALDDRYFKLERLHGEEGAQLAAGSHTAAIDFIQTTAVRERIDCDFERVDGYLFVPPGESSEVLERELAAARRAGLAGVEMVSRAPIPSYDTGRCLRFPLQGQFDPIKYLRGLIASIERRGGQIFSHTHVDEVEDGTPCCVHTNTGWRVRADSVVVATNTPVNDRVTIHTKQAAYRSYVIAAPVPSDLIPLALFWDTLDPYHYVRLQRRRGKDLLIVGGEDHKTGQKSNPQDCWKALEMWTCERFPFVDEPVYRWSGQIMEPVDGVAFIGRNPGDKHVYIATGDSGHGMTHGTIAGMMLADLIQGRETPWCKLYDPARKTLRSAGEFARENLNVAARYSEWATGGDVKSVEDLLPDCGAIIRRGVKKIATYRAEDGSVHECSAVCPHMGCVVHWNDVEKTWDCPCHGSRFDKYGSVLNGPAIRDLTPLSHEHDLATKE